MIVRVCQRCRRRPHVFKVAGGYTVQCVCENSLWSLGRRSEAVRDWNSGPGKGAPIVGGYDTIFTSDGTTTYPIVVYSGDVVTYECDVGKVTR
jgi:hypothetical protein